MAKPDAEISSKWLWRQLGMRTVIAVFYIGDSISHDYQPAA